MTELKSVIIHELPSFSRGILLDSGKKKHYTKNVF